MNPNNILNSDRWKSYNDSNKEWFDLMWVDEHDYALEANMANQTKQEEVGSTPASQ